MWCKSTLAAVALASFLSAQGSVQALRTKGPAGRVHYDLGSGKVTKVVRAGGQVGTEPRAPSRMGTQRAGVTSFNNTLVSGYFVPVSLGAEYVDWATKYTADTFMTAFTFGYATAQDDSTIGGGGASLDLSFYSGTYGGGGFCNLGTELGRFVFTGLPGKTGSVPTGFGYAYNVTSFLPSGLCVPNGQIGWGYSGEDSDGAGNSNTGPRTTDFGTNTGWRDSFQWYSDPASLNTCQGTFWFGGCTTGLVPPPGTGGNFCASFLLGITEYAPSVSPTCSFRNTTNPPNLALLSPPVIGGSLVLGTLSPIAGYAVTSGPLPGIPLTGLLNGDLLCDPTTLFGGIQVSVVGALSLPLPKDQGLEGLGFCVQAGEFQGPGDFKLTNALDCVVGGGAPTPALSLTQTVDHSTSLSKVITFTVTSDGEPVDNATVETDFLLCVGASNELPGGMEELGTTGVIGQVVALFRIKGCGTAPQGCTWRVRASKPGFADATVEVDLTCP